MSAYRAVREFTYRHISRMQREVRSCSWRDKQLTTINIDILLYSHTRQTSFEAGRSDASLRKGRSLRREGLTSSSRRLSGYQRIVLVFIGPAISVIASLGRAQTPVDEILPPPRLGRSSRHRNPKREKHRHDRTQLSPTDAAGEPDANNLLRSMRPAPQARHADRPYPRLPVRARSPRLTSNHVNRARPSGWLPLRGSFGAGHPLGRSNVRHGAMRNSGNLT